MYAIELLIGFILLVGGGHWLIQSTGKIAVLLRVPTLIISLVLIAYGSSSPEIAVSLSAALKGANEIVIGNVVGSNIINIALVLALGALVAPLKAHLDLLKREAPILLVVTALMGLSLIDGKLSRIEGIIGLTLGAAYTAYLIFAALKERKKNALHSDAIVGKSKGGWALHAVIGIVSLAAMIYGADLFVKGSIQLSEILGLSPMVIGIVVVAIGTSLPELVTTIMAVIKKEDDIAISNVMGSNIFNILIVLGITATVSPITLNPSSAGPASNGLWVDMAVMGAVAVALVVLISSRTHRILRWHGAVLLTGYIGYTTYLFLR